MFKKKSTLVMGGLLLSAALLMSGCSDKEASNKGNNLIMVSGDTVSEKGGCVLASRFSVGDKVVFRMNALDPITNKPMEKAKMQVHLSTGEVLDMAYGEHPPGVDNPAKFFVAAYPVTAETPTGTLEYFVTAEDGNKKGEFRPFNVAPSLLTIVDPKTVSTDGQVKEKTEQPKLEEKTDIVTNQNVDIIATNFKFNQDKFYVKAGEEVTVKLTSKEGSHGIMIMGLEATIDKPNGSVKFTPTKPGEYQIHCSVFCGEGHGEMTATLVVI